MVLLRDRSEAFEGAGVRAVGISRDSPWTHVSWMQALDLNFPLLSDWNGEAVRGFGIARDFRGMSDVARRSAFLVDTDGTVRGAWAYEDADVPDMDELLTAARGLRDSAEDPEPK
jgi:glutaredoxin-dependent peroxiredoxin